jgi:hypothetical protein
MKREAKGEGVSVMKLNVIKKLFMGALVALIVLTGFGALTAEAHNRVVRRHRRVIFVRRYDPFWDTYRLPTYRVVDPIAAQREEGYSDGRSKGKDDAKDGRENDPESHKQFNKSKSYAYRQAFLQGYADGYRLQLEKND